MSKAAANVVYKLQVTDLQERTCDKLEIVRVENAAKDANRHWKTSGDHIAEAEKEIAELIYHPSKNLAANATAPKRPNTKHLPANEGALTEFLWRLNYLTFGGILDIEIPSGLTVERAVENALRNLQKEAKMKIA